MGILDTISISYSGKDYTAAVIPDVFTSGNRHVLIGTHSLETALYDDACPLSHLWVIFYLDSFVCFSHSAAHPLASPTQGVAILVAYSNFRGKGKTFAWVERYQIRHQVI